MCPRFTLLSISSVPAGVCKQAPCHHSSSSDTICRTSTSSTLAKHIIPRDCPTLCMSAGPSTHLALQGEACSHTQSSCMNQSHKGGCGRCLQRIGSPGLPCCWLWSCWGKMSPQYGGGSSMQRRMRTGGSGGAARSGSRGTHSSGGTLAGSGAAELAVGLVAAAGALSGAGVCKAGAQCNDRGGGGERRCGVLQLLCVSAYLYGTHVPQHPCATAPMCHSTHVPWL
jgi:hypothetical protein